MKYALIAVGAIAIWLAADAAALADGGVPPLVGELQRLGRADGWMLACGWREAGSDPLRQAALASLARDFPTMQGARGARRGHDGDRAAWRERPWRGSAAVAGAD